MMTRRTKKVRDFFYVSFPNCASFLPPSVNTTDSDVYIVLCLVVFFFCLIWITPFRVLNVMTRSTNFIEFIEMALFQYIICMPE